MTQIILDKPASDEKSLRDAIRSHLTYTIGKDERSASIADWLAAPRLSARRLA